MSTVILQLKSLGVENVARFGFLSPPSSEAMLRGLEMLYCLGGLDEYARLSMPMGTQLSELPVDPMLGTMVLLFQYSRLKIQIITTKHNKPVFSF